MKRLVFLLPLFLSCCHVSPSFADDVQCLAEAIYYEARGEGQEGMMAVAQVVMNRIYDHRYPDDPCSVIKQKKSVFGKWICQFTYRCAPIRPVNHNNQIERIHWMVANSIAKCYLREECIIEQIPYATLYHVCTGRSAVSPNWDWKKLKYEGRIGTHCFFREV